MNGFWTAVITISTAIVTLAIVATVVSKNANTSGVIGSYFGGLSSAVSAATGPVTGNGATNSPSLGSLGSILPTYGTSAFI